MINEKLINLPKSPGCYLMKDIHNNVIYVGKAKNLFNRVKSYFSGVHDYKTAKLVSNIHDFEYIKTNNDTEAYILEMNLIKKHRPKYNIKLVDDKTYPYIVITKERHPRIYYTRDINKKYAHCYGPYPNASAARETANMLNKIYPFRKCRLIPKKECLYYHIGQCLAPCIKEINEQEYKQLITNANSFLKGNIKDEIKNLQNLMRQSADELNFEKAVEYRDLIESLNQIAEKQKMEITIKDTDIFAYISDLDNISIQVFHIRDQKVVERSGFLYELFETPEMTFINFIRQFYLLNGNPIPSEILIPKIDTELFEEHIKIKLTIPKQGRKKELVELVKENAMDKLTVLLNQRDMRYAKTIGALNNLAERLKIEYPRVIEAFDNSNIQGASAVSAMVSYVDGVPNKNLYRKYKIQTVSGSDDVRTMEEVIYRRYVRLKNENAPLPNLIIIDGGKAQTNKACEVIDKLGLIIPVLGLAKDSSHNTDYLYFAGEDIYLKKRSKEFLLLSEIQDEVHRYAISFHHQVHSKNILSSLLDDISGIGKVKKEKILRLFGDDDFENGINELKLTEEQKKQVLDIYNNS